MMINITVIRVGIMVILVLIVSLIAYGIFNEFNTDKLHIERCSEYCYSQNNSYIFIKQNSYNAEQCICLGTGVTK